MPWWMFEVDEGLVGVYATKRAALADHAPIWKVRRIQPGVYEVYRGYSATDHDGPWWLYARRALARADGWTIEETKAEVRPRRTRKRKRRMQRITLAECRYTNDRLLAKIEAQRATLVAGAGRLTVKCLWFDPVGNPIGEEVMWLSKPFAMALLEAFTAQEDAEISTRSRERHDRA